MKKILICICAVLLALSAALFIGCGTDTEPPGTGGDTPPVVTGVEDGAVYIYGEDEVTPVFDIGTATLQKDEGAPQQFESGTKLSDLGEYCLVVTNGTESVTIRFTIEYRTYPNQITDMFEGDQLSPEYITLGGGLSSIDENGDAKLENIDDAVTTWSFMKREFQNVDIETYPYIEIDIGEISAGLASFKLSSTETPASSEEEIGWNFETGGKYYINAASAFEYLGLEKGDSVWAHIGKGREVIDTDYYVTVRYYKSITEIPQVTQPAGQYIDNTMETLNQWQASTANMRWFEGDEYATGIVTSETQEYGKVLKRVQLNTSLYPFLIVDIERADNCTWSLACKYVDFEKDQTEISLAKGGVGKTEIYLTPILGDSQNIDIILYFYVVGTGSIGVNGFVNQAEPLYPPMISGISDGEKVNLNLFKVAPQFDKGTATLSKDGGAETEFISGTEITEPGKYVLKVKHGTLEKVVSFELIKPPVQEGLLDDYCSEKGFTQRDPNETSLELTADGVKFTKTSGDGWTEISKQYTFDLSVNNYLVLDIRESGYTPDAGFAIELKCESVAPWYTFGISGFENMDAVKYDGGWLIYIQTPVYTGDVETVKSAPVKFCVSIGFGGPKTIILHELSVLTQAEYEEAVAGL